MAERTNLELLVLALVGRGLVTPYDLNSKAGLSVGATIPALKRLREDGLVTLTAGPRRSGRAALTGKGRQALRRGLRGLDDPVPPDFESIIRVAYLLWLTSSAGKVQAFLRRAAAKRRLLGVASQASAAGLLADRYPPDLGFGHRWMRALTSVRRFASEGEALEELAQRLREIRR